MTTRNFTINPANGAQVVLIPGGQSGAQIFGLTWDIYPTAGTALIEWQSLSTGAWATVTGGTSVAITSAVSLTHTNNVAAYRVTISSIAGGYKGSASVADTGSGVGGPPGGAGVGLPRDNVGNVYGVTDPVTGRTLPYATKYLSYNRSPSPSDNANKGYTSSSIWQFSGEILQPAITPDTTSGAWQVVENPTPGLPIDVLGAAAKCAGGLVALKQGFTGAAVQLTATVASTPTTTDINILAGGQLDNDAVRKVLASADAGTFVYVTKVYDQTGNANHVVFSFDATYQTRGFYILWDALLNCYVLATDNNVGSNRSQSLNIPAAVSLSPNATSAFFFGRGVSSANGISNSVFFSMGTGVAGFSVHAMDAGVGPSLACWMPGAGGQYPQPTDTAWAPIDCRPCVASYIGATGSVTMSVNEYSYTRSFAVTATSYTGGKLGIWDLATGKASAMRFVGFALANATATAAQIRSVKNWFYTRYNARPQAKDRVYYVGDSRTMQLNSDGSPTSGQASNNIPSLLAEYLNSDCQVIGAGQGGFMNSDIAAKIIPGIVKQYQPGVKNVVVFLAGINDFLIGGLTPAQSVAALAANVSAAKAAGYTTIVIAELATTSTTGSANTNLPILRGLINAGGSGADYVLDVADMTPVVTPSNTALYADGTHQTEVVSRLVASRVAALVDSILSA
jgi:hypothetical protein